MGHLWARQGGGKRRKKASKKERAGRKNVLTNKWSETNIVQEAKGARKSFQPLKKLYKKNLYIGKNMEIFERKEKNGRRRNEKRESRGEERMGRAMGRKMGNTKKKKK